MIPLSAGRFEKLGVVLDVAAGGGDDRAADGAVVAYARERYHAWYTCGTAAGCEIRTAESADPAEWGDARAAAFAEPPPGTAGAAGASGWRSWLRRSGGRSFARDPYAMFHQRMWYLWYSVAGAPEPSAADPCGIWCCTSAAPERWVGHAVALEPGAEFDGVAVAEPAVVRDPRRATWLMAYAASDGTTWRVGLAESVDLLRWTRAGVLLEPWSPAVTACRTPRLLWMGERWLLTLAVEVDGRWGVYGTTSADSVWWATPVPLLEPELPTEADGQRAGFPLRVGSDLYLYYGGLAAGTWRTHAAVARGVFAGDGT